MVRSAESRREAIGLRHPQWVEERLEAYFDRTATEFAGRPLILTDERLFTYEEVVELSIRFANTLTAQGVRQGDRVGLVMANYPLTVPMLFGIWRIGAIAVPINTLYRADELEFVIRDAGCALLIIMDRFGERRFARELDQRALGWRDGRCKTLPELKGALIYDDAHPYAHFDATTYAPPVVSSMAIHDPAVIMFTSGTTGAPKGVVQTHDNLLRAAYAGAYHQAFEDGRRAVFSLPLYHAFGLVVGLLSGLVVGGSIIPLLRFDPDAILRAIGAHRATFLMAVPTMTISLLKQAKRHSYDFSSLTAVHSAAAPTPSWVWEEIKEIFGCDEIFTSYGQTETTATIVCTKPTDPIEIVSETQGCVVQAGVAGIPELGGVIAEFKTINPTTGEELPVGTTGELCTKGPLNSLGYFRNQSETEKLLLPGGWLKMGDLGQFRADGNLLLTGRTKDLYKSRGELVSPKELEQILTTHPSVSQAFFIGMPDSEYGECGCAWVVRAENQAISTDEVLSFLSTRVARYKLPRDVWFIEESQLPKTGTGKVQKSILRDMAIQTLAERIALAQGKNQ